MVEFFAWDGFLGYIQQSHDGSSGLGAGVVDVVLHSDPVSGE
jgi:hypothetical protein